MLKCCQKWNLFTCEIKSEIKTLPQLGMKKCGTLTSFKLVVKKCHIPDILTTDGVTLINPLNYPSPFSYEQPIIFYFLDCREHGI